MNPDKQGSPLSGFRFSAPNYIGAAPLRAPMNSLPVANVGCPVTPQPIYPFVSAQQNLYAGGQSPSFVAENQVYPDNSVSVVQQPDFGDPQNISLVPVDAKFPPDSRVGFIEFIGPNGAHVWLNASDFAIVGNGLIIDDQNESLILQRRRKLPDGQLKNEIVDIPFQHNHMADNPSVQLNRTSPAAQSLQNDSIQASNSQASSSNLPASETLKVVSRKTQRIEEPMVGNSEVVIKPKYYRKTGQVTLQDVLNQQEPGCSVVASPRTINNVTKANSVQNDERMVTNFQNITSQMAFPLHDQVQPLMEVDVPIKTKVNDFCWTCRRPVADEDNRFCSCGLAFHKQCQSATVLPTVSGISPTNGQYTEIELDSSQMTGKCEECVLKEAGALYNRIFGMDENEANIVFAYAAAKLVEDNGLVCFKKLPAIRTEKLMDLDTVIDKAEQNDSYRCIEQFMFDIKSIIHHARIVNENYNGTFTETKLDELFKSAKVEMNYISTCPDCYRNYFECTNEQTMDSAADIPCPNPHGLVWAKKDNYWFPGKVYEYRVEDHFNNSQDLVSVVFFGFDEKAPIQVNASECLMYSKKYPGKKRFSLKPFVYYKARSAVCQYVRNLDLFFCHDYRVPELATEFALDKIFLDINDLKDRKEALEKIKLPID